MPDPFFFPSNSHQLYGVYHEPQTTNEKNDSAVLLCYPIGQEYMRIHKTYKNLANQLARKGLHVMRFDYYGTGDSSGEDGDGYVQAWIDNISSALQELKKKSHASKFSLFGARMGATLAYLYQSTRIRVKELVLWDPILNGPKYLATLDSMQHQILKDLNRFAVNRTHTFNDIQDRIGFTFSDTLRNTLSEIDLINADTPKVRHCSLFSSHNGNNSEYKAFADSLSQSNIKCEIQEVDTPCSWEQTSHIEAALLPGTLLKTIGDKLSS